MESLTRVVSESLARHGFERPVDYRRLRWSRWFRCESHHSLLSVPSRPGVFALAEEIMDFGNTMIQGGADPLALLPSLSETNGSAETASRQPRAAETAHMLGVHQFFEDDDMAFTLDRMLSWQNPMRTRLESGRYFIRYVIIEDEAQRRSICAALNQWIASSSEKATGIGVKFSSSTEPPATDPNVSSPASQQVGCAKASDIRCPALLPSGF